MAGRSTVVCASWGDEAVRINITETLSSSAGAKDVVLFASPLGSSRGRWMGPELARPGGVYDVELDFPDQVGAFEVLAPGSAERLHWPEESGAVPAVGTVVATVVGTVVGEIDDAGDPVVGISLGGDVVLLEAPTAGVGIAVGDSVAFRASRLDVYPYEL